MRVNDPVSPEIKRIKAELEKLRHISIKVGIQGDEDSELLMIAGVHEYGATITAKKAKNLTIPISPKAKGKRAADFPDLFVHKADTGNVFLAREIKRGKNKGTIECLFWLTPSVTIPERSFIRGGYDNSQDALAQACKRALLGVLKEKWTAEQAADHVGMAAVGIIKRYFSSLEPPKSSLTLSSDPGKTSPLMNSGRLRNSITYKVVTEE